jgi:5-methylcytosine-specific restriction endonuclease McrA
MISVYSIPMPAVKEDVFVSLYEEYKDACQCEHSWKLHERKDTKERIHYYYVCHRCGAYTHEKGHSFSQEDKEWAIKSHDSQEFWTWIKSLRDAHQKQHLETLQRKRDEAQNERNRNWWAWYNAYLESDIWKAKRALVIQRANGVCEACLCADASEVHHKTYQNVGKEPLFDLVAVCSSCHKDIHQGGKTA